RRRGAHAFGVFDNFRRLAFHDGDARIGGAEVDADDLAHGSSSQMRQAGRATWRPSRECRRLIRRPPIQPPWITRFAAFSRLMAHIGGGSGAASQSVTKSRGPEGKGRINGYRAIAASGQPG